MKQGGTIDAIGQALSEESCRVTLRVDYEPQGFVESAGSFFGFVGGRVRGDLRRFREYIESRGEETGEWHGRIAV